MLRSRNTAYVETIIEKRRPTTVAGTWRFLTKHGSSGGKLKRASVYSRYRAPPS